MSKTYNVAVIKGDGTGPEVMAEGLKVAKAAAEKYGFSLNLTNTDIGGERFLKTGDILTDSDFNTLKEQDAIYLSAIGHPDVKPGVLEQGILLKLRFELDQYINLRPIKLAEGVKSPLANKGSKEIDFVVVRENTEGLYANAGGFLKKGTQDEIAIQESINSRKGVERCLRYAFEVAQKRDKKLHMVGKTNVLTYAFDLWERTYNEVGEADYKDVERLYHHVDACCMFMVHAPEMYNTIVTDNMFGDIITDVGAIIQGGLGVAASGNINPNGVSMFEPVGGSAPQFTGQNIINPIACINAGAMLLRHVGEEEAAKAIEVATAKVAGELPGLGINEMGMGTDAVGDKIKHLVLSS